MNELQIKFDADVKEKFKDIYDVFVDYYGEDRVDIMTNREYPSSDTTYNLRLSASGAYIIIYFDEVEVINEDDDCHTIKEVYVRIRIDSLGRCSYGLELTRALYSRVEAESGYCFSHVPVIEDNYFPDYHNCCLGDGPIRNTFTTLVDCKDLDMYSLLAREIDLYVHTESLEGGPYIPMANIVPGTTFVKYSPSYINNVKRLFEDENINSDYYIYEFPSYYIDQFTSHLLKETDFLTWLNFRNGMPTKSFFEVANRVTDEFLKKYPTSEEEFLVNCRMQEGVPYILSSRRNGNLRDSGFRVVFKGEYITPRVEMEEDDTSNSSNYITLIDPNYLSYLMDSIIVLNKYYNGATKNQTSGNIIIV